jgi:hypothetical protein
MEVNTLVDLLHKAEDYLWIKAGLGSFEHCPAPARGLSSPMQLGFERLNMTSFGAHFFVPEGRSVAWIKMKVGKSDARGWMSFLHEDNPVEYD